MYLKTKTKICYLELSIKWTKTCEDLVFIPQSSKHLEKAEWVNVAFVIQQYMISNHIQNNMGKKGWDSKIDHHFMMVSSRHKFNLALLVEANIFSYVHII